MATNRNERRERRRIAEWCGRNGVPWGRFRSRRGPYGLMEHWQVDPKWEISAWYRGYLARCRLIAEFPTPEADRG